MSNLKPFQLVALMLFAALSVGGVIAFATFRADDAGEIVNEVTLWGTLDSQSVGKIIEAIAEERGEFKVRYEQKSPATFDQDLLEALALDRGPDLVFLSHERLLTHENKLQSVSYELVSERLFRNSFLDAGDIFLTREGILAFPVGVDPLVMYWNRTLFANEALVSPPDTWVDFRALAPTLTKRTGETIIKQATLPLGEYVNVRNAKEVLSALMMQAGTPVVARSARGVAPRLLDDVGLPERPADSALRFFTEFVDPRLPTYSWNRSLPEARDFFAAGDLAVYFGFASELPVIREKNPNLNFDVAELPQTLGSDERVTFATLTGVALVRGSRSPNDAFAAARILSGEFAGERFAQEFTLPPVQRALLRRKPGTAFGDVLFDAAITSRAWLDPDPRATEGVFRHMIESTTSGRLSVGRAIVQANEELGEVLSARD